MRARSNAHFCLEKCLGDVDVPEGAAGKLQVALIVLADNGLLLGAVDVVPLDAILVEVVHDGQAGLATDAVVRLGPAVAAGVGPLMEAPVDPLGAVGWGEPGLVGGPEPAIDVLGEELRLVTAVKVTEAARGPEKSHI